jgi:hypothetical protein
MRQRRKNTRERGARRGFVSSPRGHLLVLTLLFGGAVGAQIALRQRDTSKTSLLALALRPAKDLFPSGTPFGPNDVEKLLQSVDFEVRSPAQGPASEPEGFENVAGLFEGQAAKLGVGRSPFLASSRWAVVRYLGPSPAGRGLKGKALEDAQRAALGTPDDTIPVVTAVATITKMMDDYFAPLLARLPGGQDILSSLRVQGAYYAPNYVPPENSDDDVNNDSIVGRDNAYVTGLQSLEIYPSGCFDDEGASREGCTPPFFSTGHDPTIVGHELGHVLFNHMRQRRALEGFQWFAVNEGYADYFSAAYFKDPFVGRIWKVDKTAAPYLRRLIDNPKVSDEAYSQEIHAFSIIWSSSLWRIRERLLKDFGAKPNDVDRVMLYSIAFLGETDKARLGDAATAVLRAAETLGYPSWKDVMKEEFAKAEVALKAPADVVLARRGDDIGATGQTTARRGLCGVVGSAAKGAAVRSANRSPPGTLHNNSLHVAHAAFLLAPLLASLLAPFGRAVLGAMTRKRHRPSWRSSLWALLSLFGISGGLRGCKSESEEALSAPGYSLAYMCDSETMTNEFRKDSPVFFTWYEPTSSDSPVQRVLVSDDRFERSRSSIIAILDKERIRIEQVRDRDGKPLELSMTSKYISTEEALAFQFVRIANLVLDSSVTALVRARALAQTAPSAKEPVSSASLASLGKEAVFQFEDKSYVAMAAESVKGGFGYGPLASKILRTGASGTPGSTACRHVPDRSSP